MRKKERKQAVECFELKTERISWSTAKTLRVKSKMKVKDNEQISALFMYFINFVFV